MKFKLEFELDDDIFVFYSEVEVERILHAVSKKIVSGDISSDCPSINPVYDFNGRFIGELEITDSL